jgi:hypothetical protein
MTVFNYQFHLDRWEAFKLVLKEKRQDQAIDNIRRLNHDLERITGQWSQLSQSKCCRKSQSHAADSYNIIRTQAISLHEVLRKTLQISCHDGHSASLELENCFVKTNLRFGVLFGQHERAEHESCHLRWNSLVAQPVRYPISHHSLLHSTVIQTECPSNGSSLVIEPDKAYFSKLKKMIKWVLILIFINA